MHPFQLMRLSEQRKFEMFLDPEEVSKFHFRLSH